MIIIVIIILWICYKIIKHLLKDIKSYIKENKYYCNENNNYYNTKNNNKYNINYYENQNTNVEENYNNIVTINYKKYYKPRRYITTLNELNFYNTLLEITRELDLILFAQVSLYSIIETRENLDYSTKTTYFNKINRKSIDFVLVNKENCRVKLCIELDDPTHYRKKRIERDNFINELFKELEIPLLRYPSYTIYYKEPLKKKILENIKDTYYE